MADASALTLPATLMAFSRGVMGEASFNHDRECAPHTNVMASACLITSVKSLGDRLKEKREELGLSQGELAKRAGVSQGTIGNLEAGIRKTARALVSIAKALGVSPEWLQTGHGGHAAPAGGGVVLVEGEAERQLLADLAELLPEHREQIMAEIHQRAEEMRRHAAYVLQKAGVSAPAPDARVAKHIRPAPPSWDGHERRHENKPVQQERRESYMRDEDLGGGARRSR
jgi:transcriptional regulator with XRE-family HTH domain